MKIKGVDAIIQLFEDCFKEGDTNLLLLVDQFEEIFRFTMQSLDKESRGVTADLQDPQLQLALDWLDKKHPIEEWADRYQSRKCISYQRLGKWSKCCKTR